MLVFTEYVNRKQKDAIRELKVVKRLLKYEGFQVASHLHSPHDDPYLFVYNPEDAPKFGIRIYKLGGQDIYYRPQKKEKTHPWGEAYTLDIKSIFEDLSSEEGESSDSEEGEGESEDQDDKVAKNIMKAVGDEIRDFFKKNAKAEKHKGERLADKSPLGSIAIRPTLDVGDFSNTAGNASKG